MRFYNKKYLLLMLPFSLLSCRKYVENVPIQGQRVIEYTDDYRMLMNNANMLEVSFGLPPALSNDDTDMSAAPLQANVKNNVIQTAIYTWSKPFYVGTTTDNDYNAIYAGIYTFNTVIRDVKNSKGGTELLKNTLLGEALVHRAFGYFTLANLYGRTYDAATAAQDPAVPLILEPKLFVDLTRASVQQVYSRVIEDTKRAIPLLPLKQDINFRPNKASAYALLAKAYLFMRDFNAARLYADSTLALSSELYDYNTSQTTFPTQYNDKQVLLRKVARAVVNTTQLSESILSLLGTKDLRYVLFVRPGSSFSPVFTGSGYWSRNRYNGSPDNPAIGLTINETWLIRAECLARAGEREAALTQLNDFRKLRFRPADYVPLTAADNDAALRLVINERRLEFFGSGLRWFDQRRLNKDALFAQTYSRVFDNITYTLEPNSNKYVFPFAQLTISQNPEIIQNPD